MMTGVSNTRRLRQGKKPGHLKIVSDRAQAGAAELAEFRQQLAAAGAPAEMLQVLDTASDMAGAIQQLTDAGLLPAPEDSVSGLLEHWQPLLEPGCDPLSAELCGTQFLGMIRGAAPDEVALPDLLSELIGQVRQFGGAAALAMLRVLAVLGPPVVRPVAAEAAAALIATGLTDQPWARGLGNPRAGRCFGYADAFGAQESIAVTFAYGRKSHALVVLIDHDLGGGVKDCFLSDRPARIRAKYQQAARGFGLEFCDYPPAEAGEILGVALSREPCPVEPDQLQDVADHLDLLRARVELLAGAGGSPGRAGAAGPRGTRSAGDAGARRDAGGRPAGRTGTDPAVHRVKITLRGSRPPIWRRLEVPSGITLNRLHQSIQAAFGWTDSHLWVFDTPAGEYGNGGGDLGFRSAASAKLADVAALPGDRIRYTYDFGDDWEHDITVEDVLPAEPGVAYPRSTAGRRGCPPEDCGGLCGYQELLEILADPQDEEHAARLEWLGVAAAAEFDPARFDLGETNQALSGLAKVLRKPKVLRKR
jgi:Plasmid pRiA4b ORF-3-like protein